MRGRLLGTSATTPSMVVVGVGAVVLVLVASCGFPTSRGPTCADEIELCPQSSKSATSVTCDCRCTVGFTEDTGQTFDGHVAVCLPPAAAPHPCFCSRATSCGSVAPAPDAPALCRDWTRPPPVSAGSP